jgi:hypothetical protein
MDNSVLDDDHLRRNRTDGGRQSVASGGEECRCPPPPPSPTPAATQQQNQQNHNQQQKQKHSSPSPSSNLGTPEFLSLRGRSNSCIGIPDESILPNNTNCLTTTADVRGGVKSNLLSVFTAIGAGNTAKHIHSSSSNSIPRSTAGVEASLTTVRKLSLAFGWVFFI